MTERPPKVLATRLGTWYGTRRPDMKMSCRYKKKRHFCFNGCGK